jgi:hypothetical protein
VLTDRLLFSSEQIKLIGNKYLKYLNHFKLSVYFIYIPQVFALYFDVRHFIALPSLIQLKKRNAINLFRHSKLETAYRANNRISDTLNRNKTLYNKIVPASSHSFNKLNVTQHRNIFHNGSKAALDMCVYVDECRNEFPETQFIHSL